MLPKGRKRLARATDKSQKNLIIPWFAAPIGYEVEVTTLILGNQFMSDDEIDDEIRLHLTCGNEDEIERGFELLHAQYQKPICGWLRRNHFPGMSAEDLKDLWSETLLEFYAEVKSGKYDGTRRVFSDLCRIIQTNGIDLRRKKKSNEKRLQIVGETLRDTQVNEKWRQREAEDRQVILEMILDEVSKLSPKQKVALEAYINNFPESADMQQLRKFTSDLTGVEETLASVKRGLQEGRRKIRNMLARKGIIAPQSEDDNE